MALDPFTALFDIGKVAIEKIWPDETKRSEQMFKLKELEQNGDLEVMKLQISLLVGQMEVNKVEAASDSLFVAGWRPAVGWICALSLGWTYLGFPVAEYVMAIMGHKPVLPSLPFQEGMFELIFGMLGLGGLRTWEKHKKLTK